MCDTNAINIEMVNGQGRTTEQCWGVNLVTNDPPTHLVILLTISGVSDPITTRTMQ